MPFKFNRLALLANIFSLQFTEISEYQPSSRYRASKSRFFPYIHCTFCRVCPTTKMASATVKPSTAILPVLDLRPALQCMWARSLNTRGKEKPRIKKSRIKTQSRIKKITNEKKVADEKKVPDEKKSMSGHRTTLRNVSCSTSTPKKTHFLQNTSCIRKLQVISGRGAHPLHPPPRSAPVTDCLLTCLRTYAKEMCWTDARWSEYRL